jgi:NTP pyrophosphatase (non-canonical NTP hydrolase)
MVNFKEMASVRRNDRQHEISTWGIKAFGVEESTSPPQRALRLLEEALELCQACGLEKEIIPGLVDHIYSKEPGSVDKEIGDVSVTILILAEAFGLSADACEAKMVNTLLAKDPAEHAARNANKNKLGFRTKHLTNQ